MGVDFILAMAKPSQQDLRVFNDSFQRCKENGRFFELFAELRDVVGEKRDWRLTVYAVMLAAVTGDSLRLGLDEGWLGDLIAAARSGDPKFDNATEKAWRAVMGHGLKNSP